MDIVHIVHNSKFTNGYISFMEKCFPEYTHNYITKKGPDRINRDLADNIVFINKSREILYNADVRKLLKKADKIIISGMFGEERMFCFYPKSILNKLYINYWGGDFYPFRNRARFISFNSWIKENISMSVMKKCHANIFLIKPENKVFEDITGIRKKYFVGSMYGDPDNRFSIHSDNEEVSDRILLGNSATPENHHKEIIDILADHKDRIEVLCPLSYGNDEYRKEILEYGKNKLGSSFVPVLDFMAYQEYVDMLATCRVGIFNNDRQQAMGNITIMLYLKKKIYARKDTSMFENYIDHSLKIHSVDELKNISVDELLACTDEEKENNYNNKMRMDALEPHVSEWRKVFLD